METASYNDAIQVAANLIEPENYDNEAEGGNPEYVRGQVELICDLFGYTRHGVEPREGVEEDLRRKVYGVREPVFPSPEDALRLASDAVKTGLAPLLTFLEDVAPDREVTTLLRGIVRPNVEDMDENERRRQSETASSDPYHNPDLPYDLKASAFYSELLAAVSHLTEGLEGGGFEESEYARGCINLLADVFGRFEMDTADRMKEVEAEIRARRFEQVNEEA